MNTDREMEPTELCILIPQEMIGDGDPGDIFTEPVIALIRAMATVGYAPTDFGEDHYTDIKAIELWFCVDDMAEGTAEYFIKNGGAC